MSDIAPPPCIEDGSARRTWIIVHEPGLVPQTKRPPDQSHMGVITFLRELMANRASETRFIIAVLSYGFDLWVQDGREFLAIDAAFAASE